MPKRRRLPPGFSEDTADYEAPPHRLPKPARLPDGTTIYFMRVGPKGRALLPSDLRAAMGLAEGDLIVATLKDGVLRVESQKQVIRNIQQDLRRQIGDRSLVDELIAERRAAAARGE